MKSDAVDPSDVNEICQLKARYFRYVDRKRWVDLRRVFTDDCVFEGLWASAETPEKFVSNISANFGPEVTSIHHGYMPELRLMSADVVRGVWAMSDYLDWPTDSRHYLGISLLGQRGIRGYGYYEEEYRRSQHGWLISHMRLTRLRIDPLIGEHPTLPYPLIAPDDSWLA